MTNKQIAALINTGVVIFTTVLCWPGGYTTISSFYRAVVINIASVFINEIPKFKENFSGQPIRIAKIILTLLGFVVLGIGMLNISHPYDNKILPQAFGVGEWIYFFTSCAVCVVTFLNFIEVMRDKSHVMPKVVACAPSESVK